MKHITRITVAKANASKNTFDDIVSWLEDLWDQIVGLFKGDN